MINVYMYLLYYPNLNLFTALVYVTKFFPTIIMSISSSHFLPFLNQPHRTQIFHLLESSVFVQIHPKEQRRKKISIHHQSIAIMSFSTSPFLLPYSSQFLPTNPMHPILLIPIQIKKALTFACHHVPSTMTFNLYLLLPIIGMSFPILPPIFLSTNPLQAPKSFAFACHHVSYLPPSPHFLP